MTKALHTRQKLIDRNAKLIRTKIVDIDLGDGEIAKVEVRSPTMTHAGTFGVIAESTDGLVRMRAMVQMVIKCTFDPESGNPLFSDADEDLLLQGPADGGWIGSIFSVLGDLASEAKAAAKN